MASGSNKRFRITVPDNDKAVLAWLEEQLNVSASMRELVRRHVAQYGLVDVFSSDVPDADSVKQKSRSVRKTGRPVGVRDAEYDEVEVAEDVSSAVQSVAKQQDANAIRVQTAIRSPRRSASKPKGSGIQMTSDALSEFGVELEIEDASETSNGDPVVDDAMAAIAEMMGA